MKIGLRKELRGLFFREYWNRFFEKKRGFSLQIIAGGVLFVVAIALCFLVFSDRNQEASVDQIIPLQDSSWAKSEATIMVDVKGAVLFPGVYSLPADSRVQDGIEAAGGFCNEEDSMQLNLAKKLTDGDVILVGEIQQNQALLNINLASAGELEVLPGIGPVLSQRIVQYREDHGLFLRIEDLKQVKGIGNALFEKLKILITV